MPFLHLHVGAEINFEVRNPLTGRVATYKTQIESMSPDDNPMFRTYNGMYQGKRIYFVEFKENQRSRYNLSCFKRMNRDEQIKYEGARLVINSQIPEYAQLILPSHLKCYLLQQPLNAHHIIDESNKPKAIVHFAKAGFFTQQIQVASAFAPAPAPVSPLKLPSVSLFGTPQAFKRLEKAPIRVAPQIEDPALTALFQQNGAKKLVSEVEAQKKIRIAASKFGQQRVEQNKRKIVESIRNTAGLDAKKQARLAETKSPAAAAAIALDVPVKTSCILSVSAKERRLESTKNLRNWLVQAESQTQAWEHQLQTITQFCAARENNAQDNYRCNGIITLPTGTGKTGTMGMIIGNSGETVVVLVPAIKLCAQSIDDIRRFSPPGTEVVGLDKLALTGTDKKRLQELKQMVQDKCRGESLNQRAGTTTAEYQALESFKKEVRRKSYVELVNKSHVIIATYQLMQRHYEYFPWELIDGVAFDEAHHATAPEYSKMLKFLRDTAQKEVIGYTATPTKELFQLFNLNEDGSDNPIKSFDVTTAIDQKKLAPLQTALVVLKQDRAIDQIKLRKLANGEFSQTKMQCKLNHPVYNNAVVDFLLNSVSSATHELVREMQTFVVLAGINHIISFHEVLARAISVEQLDPSKKLRNAYARNIAAKKNISLEQAQVEADATFTVCEQYYSPRDPRYFNDPNKKHFDDVLARYELGGCQFLIICQSLGEGYSYKRLKQCVTFRIFSSRELLNQIGGRVLRMDPDEPGKVGHLIQIVTSDVGGNYELYAENNFSENGRISFQYGVVPTQKSVPDYQKIIVAGERAEYTAHWEAPEVVKVAVQNRNERALKKKSMDGSAQQKPRTVKKQKIHALVKDTKQDLEHLLAILEQIFSGVQDIELDESADIIEHNTVEIPAEKNQHKGALDLLEKKSEPSLISTHYTRGIKTFLGKVESRLNSMEQFLLPIYKAAFGSQGSWQGFQVSADSARPLSQLDAIAALCTQARGLAKIIIQLRKGSFNYVGEGHMDAEDEPSDDPLTVLNTALTGLRSDLQNLNTELVHSQVELSKLAKMNSVAKKSSRPASAEGSLKKYCKEAEVALANFRECSVFALVDEMPVNLLPGMVLAYLNKHPNAINQIETNTGNTLLLKLLNNLHIPFHGAASYYLNHLVASLIQKMNHELILLKNKAGANLFSYYKAANSESQRLAVTMLMGLAKREISLDAFGLDLDSCYLIDSDGQLANMLFWGIKHQHWDYCDSKGRTILHLLQTMTVEVLNYIFSHGKKPSINAIESMHLRSPLITAIEGFPSISPRITLLLLNEKPDLLLMDKYGQTAFHYLQKSLWGHPADTSLFLPYLPDLRCVNSNHESLAEVYLSALRENFIPLVDHEKSKRRLLENRWGQLHREHSKSAIRQIIFHLFDHGATREQGLATWSVLIEKYSRARSDFLMAHAQSCQFISVMASNNHLRLSAPELSPYANSFLTISYENSYRRFIGYSAVVMALNEKLGLSKDAELEKERQEAEHFQVVTEKEFNEASKMNPFGQRAEVAAASSVAAAAACSSSSIFPPESELAPIDELDFFALLHADELPDQSFFNPDHYAAHHLERALVDGDEDADELGSELSEGDSDSDEDEDEMDAEEAEHDADVEELTHLGSEMPLARRMGFFSASAPPPLVPAPVVEHDDVCPMNLA